MATEQELLGQLQERLDALEMRTAFQDDVIEQLNNEISIHQEYIRDLKEKLNLIGEKVKDLNSQPNDEPVDERPPHY
ncbi:SlyX family protein [Thalassomonas sp. M1454]|uniref:SlyX family protein n=1 Tax=Thalassomonas sp. M1454 TaxID=2594477 RepID=UPI001181296D|nr:SlyX family protein [Thalassomonas sp. M1454]TRX55226.1 SlyX family protein [Thalassomonas sp. M1454]